MLGDASKKSKKKKILRKTNPIFFWLHGLPQKWSRIKQQAAWLLRQTQLQNSRADRRAKAKARGYFLQVLKARAVPGFYGMFIQITFRF